MSFNVDAFSFSGGDGGNGVGWVPSGGLCYVHSVSNDLNLGISVGSYFTLGTNLDDGRARRYYAINNELITAFAQGSEAYRVNDWLFVGAGAAVRAYDF
jgi:long-subunit fatty acid transport protein